MADNETGAPDWRKADDYGFTAGLEIGQWAWEFLRRNPGYRRDWQWFDRTWRGLEERYGKPPNRDFVRWKADPDAWKRVDDASGECRIDEDKVLIECWLGSKWGFYKFPLSPATDRPQIGEQLLWRELEAPLHVVEDGDSEYLDQAPAHAVLGFDLDLPLRPQLEQARRYLQARQARLRKQGRLQMQTLENLAPRWRLLLRLLDARAAGASNDEIAKLLAPELAAAGTPLAELFDEADALVDGGYREMLRIPGRPSR